MEKPEYDQRIREHIEAIADGRIHQYEEVESLVYYIIWLTEQQVKNEIINKIDRIKLLSADK